MMFNSPRIFIFLMVVVMKLSACTSLQGSAATPVNEAQLTQDIISNIDTSLSDLADRQAFSGSVLIAQGERVLLNKGYGMADVGRSVPNTPQTIFRIGSLTKQFTAAAILILQDQDKLDVHDQACRYIPDCPAAWQEITIHHLLTHTSGISDRPAILGLLKSKNTSFTPTEILALFKNAPLDFTPGERFSYSNAGYDVLGYLIEQVSGQPYEAFLEHWVFEPLNMQDTGDLQNIERTATGYNSYGIKADPSDIGLLAPYSAGALYSTVEDLYLWDQALHTKSLLSEKLLNQMFISFVPATPAGIQYLGDVGYGYGWFIGERLHHQVVGHPGQIAGFWALNEYYPEDQVTIIMLSNLENIDMSVFALPSEMIFREK